MPVRVRIGAGGVQRDGADRVLRDVAAGSRAGADGDHAAEQHGRAAAGGGADHPGDCAADPGGEGTGTTGALNFRRT